MGTCSHANRQARGKRTSRNPVSVIANVQRVSPAPCKPPVMIIRTARNGIDRATIWSKLEVIIAVGLSALPVKKAVRLSGWLDTIDLAQLVAEVAEARVELYVALLRQQRIEKQSLRRRET